jgi:hypothetical protein
MDTLSINQSVIQQTTTRPPETLTAIVLSLSVVASYTGFDSRGGLPLLYIVSAELISAQGYSSASTDRAQVGMSLHRLFMPK